MKKFYFPFLAVLLFFASTFNQVSAQIPVSVFEAEPNGTSATAQVLNLAAQNVTIVRGSINPGGDLEFFRINGVAAGSKIWLVTDPGGTQVAGATSRDLVMDVLEADGTTVIENDDDDGTGNGGDGTIETGLASTIGGRTLVAGGTYFISLRAFSATGIVNPYRILIAVTPSGMGAPEVEANNTAATANILVTGAQTIDIRTGAIDVAADADYYSVVLQAGNILVISADADPERDGTGTDLVVEVRDPADALLISFDSGITGSLANPSCESGNYTITTSGTYYIRVRHFSATGTGTYHLMAAAATGTALAATPLIITEFRLRGPSGANDEFVEVYNNSGSPYTVSASDGSLGYSVAASDGVVRFTIPNGTVIPARGHYLGVNSVAYSISAYPADNGTTATGDATFATDIPDNAGIALFRTSISANFSLTTRLDAVGSVAEANTLYKEGAGYLTLTPFSIDYCFHRKVDTGLPQETDNNSADFKFEDTNGTSAGAGQQLGAPGPENLSAPLIGASLLVSIADPSVSANTAPNEVRDFTSDPGNNSTFGTYSFRYKVKNVGATPITRLRFRIDSINTFPSPSGIADLRPRTSSSVSITIPSGTFTAVASTLEQPPSQPNGGGFNSSMGVGSVTLGTPIAAGDSIFVNILAGVQQTGDFTIIFTAEGLPEGGNTFSSRTASCVLTCPANITVSNDPNQCGAVVNYPAPATTGSCGTVTASPASGSFFPVGTTTVTATSSLGPTCTFTITVNDTQAPTITCPANITVSNNPNQCGAVVTYPAPTVSDNCPGVSAPVSSPASGSFFPIGTTTVTATTTDAAGNTATCSFTVTVNDTQPPTITCPANITANSTPGLCGAVVNYSAPTISDNCPGVTVLSSPASGSFFPVGTTTVTATATDAASNTATCSFTVTVLDNQPPVITCPANITAGNDPGLCSAVVTYNLPIVTDNCQKFQAPATILPHGGGAITFAGNTAPGGFYFNITNNSAFTQTIGSLRVRFGSAAFGAVPSPAPVSVYLTTSATTYVGNQTNAGAWTAIGTNIPVTVAGPNSEFSLVPLPGSGITLAPGVTRGMYVLGTASALVYNSAGNSNFTPISNGVLTLTPGQASGGLFTTVGSSPRVPNIILNYYRITQTAGLPSGSAFPVGTTTNSFVATDDAGNTANCSFTVTVNDTQAPTVTCPANITVTSPVGSCTAVVTYAGIANDNCPGATVQLVSGPASGAAFPVGVTTVTLRAVDAAGNVSLTNCSFTVTVLDGQLPVISSQPANRTVCAGGSATFSVTASNVLTYQWQQWNGSSWNNIAGATASSYTVSNATVNMNTNSFRVILNGLCTVVTSSHATLYVNPLPSVILSATPPASILPNQTTTLNATATPTGGSFTWFFNGTQVPGVTGAALGPLNINDLGTYRVVYTDLQGCVSTSANLEVSGAVSEVLWVYPNPNFGQFQVRFYNQLNEGATVNVYDGLGQKVYQRSFVMGNTTYTQIDIDLGFKANGIYTVELVDGSGKRRGAKRIIVQTR